MSLHAQFPGELLWTLAPRSQITASAFFFADHDEALSLPWGFSSLTLILLPASMYYPSYYLVSKETGSRIGTKWQLA